MIERVVNAVWKLVIAYLQRQEQAKRIAELVTELNKWLRIGGIDFVTTRRGDLVHVLVKLVQAIEARRTEEAEELTDDAVIEEVVSLASLVGKINFMDTWAEMCREGFVMYTPDVLTTKLHGPDEDEEPPSAS